MKCPACGLDNRDSARFCKACGHPLEAAAQEPEPSQAERRDVCPSCGAPTRPNARFCRRCGADLPADAPTSPAPAGTTDRAPAQAPTEPSPPAAPQPPTPYTEPPWAEPSSTAAGMGPSQPRGSAADVAGRWSALPRWLFWVGGGIVLLALVALAVVALGGADLLPGEDGAATAPPATAPAGAVSATTSPTETLPAGDGAPTYEARVGLSPRSASLPVGAPLTVTITLTNTGPVALSNPRYQLVGDWRAYLGLMTDQVVRREGELPPQASDTAVFQLQALQVGTAALQGYTMVDVPADPENRPSFLSAETAVITVAPP